MASNDFNENFDFDEMALPFDDAAELAEQLACIRRAALNKNAYRLKLIASGVGETEAAQLAQTAAIFMGAPSQQKPPQRSSGPQTLTSILGASTGGLPGFKPGAVAKKKLDGVAFAQKKTQEAQERLAAAAAVKAAEATVAAEAEKPANAANEPDETKPLDFFLANFTDCAVKDDQATMEAPMFSLATKPDMTSWKWTSTDGKKTVVVDPGKGGRATIHDKDILIYCISRLVAAINAGKKPSRLVRFTAYDFFKATNRPTRGGDYNRFKEALNRLSGTRVTTNVETGKTRHAKGFGFINGWEIIEKSEKDDRMVAVEIELSLWIYRAIAAKEVLTINPNYFALRKPLERRLYEIARKHVGKQASWEMGIEALRDKCGSATVALRNWRVELKKIIEADTLPDYLIELQEKTVLFKPRPHPV